MEIGRRASEGNIETFLPVGHEAFDTLAATPGELGSRHIRRCATII
jgi:hypothetical protein